MDEEENFYRVVLHSLRGGDEGALHNGLDTLWNMVVAQRGIRDICDPKSGLLLTLRGFLDVRNPQVCAKVLSILMCISCSSMARRLCAPQTDFLPALLKVAQATVGSMRRFALSILWNLSTQSMPLRSLGEEERSLFLLLKQIIQDGDEHTSFAINILSNFSIFPKLKSFIGSQEFGILPLIRDAALNTKLGNGTRERAVGMVWDLSLHRAHIPYFVASTDKLGFLVDVFESVTEPSQLLNISMIALMALARDAKGAKALVESRPQLLPNLLATLEDPSVHRPMVHKARALVIASFLQEQVGPQPYIPDPRNPHAPQLCRHSQVVAFLNTVISNTLKGIGGPGFDFGNFDLCVLMAAIVSLSSREEDLPVLCDNAGMPFLGQALQVAGLFAQQCEAIPNYQSFNGAQVGGGKDDIESAEAAIIAIVRLCDYLLGREDSITSIWKEKVLLLYASLQESKQMELLNVDVQAVLNRLLDRLGGQAALAQAVFVRASYLDEEDEEEPLESPDLYFYESETMGNAVLEGMYSDTSNASEGN